MIGEALQQDISSSLQRLVSIKGSRSDGDQAALQESIDGAGLRIEACSIFASAAKREPFT